MNAKAEACYRAPDKIRRVPVRIWFLFLFFPLPSPFLFLSFLFHLCPRMSSSLLCLLKRLTNFFEYYASCSETSGVIDKVSAFIDLHLAENGNKQLINKKTSELSAVMKLIINIPQALALSPWFSILSL